MSYLLNVYEAKARGLVSLFRRHKNKLSEAQEFKFRKYLNSKPGLEQLYDFKNDIHDFLRQKNLTRKKMKYQISRFMQIIQDLKASKFHSMITLANTFESWQEEILRMLRFSRSNGITEGFHNKMEKISRIAYGFRNFQNYRERVLLQCA
jgi:transposase